MYYYIITQVIFQLKLLLSFDMQSSAKKVNLKCTKNGIFAFSYILWAKLINKPTMLDTHIHTDLSFKVARDHSSQGLTITDFLEKAKYSESG